MIDQNVLASLTLEIEAAENIEDKIAIVARQAKKITGAERCSLFVHDREKDKLQSLYADGIKGSILLKSNVGIVGYVFHKKKSMIENNTKDSPIFFKHVDLKTDYKTSSILAVPLIGKSRRLGVIELLNKENSFDMNDKEAIEAFAKILAVHLDTPESDTGKDEHQAIEEALQERIDDYLKTKRLYFMDDGRVYYKILGMSRDYYIAADQCYRLEDAPTSVKIHYYSSDGNEFMNLDMLVKLDKDVVGLLISESVNMQTFSSCSLEEE